MSDRRYGVYERFDTGDEWPLSSIPDDLVEEAAKAVGRILYGWCEDEPNGATGYVAWHESMDTARAALSVLFPGEEEE